MGKIFYLMGKSSSGKDTIFKELKKRMTFLHTVTIYTTRPMRMEKSTFLWGRKRLRIFRGRAE